MRLNDPVRDGDIVGWKNPRAPKQGALPARVRDIAGPWVLIEPMVGKHEGRRIWELHRRLVIHQRTPDPVEDTKRFLKAAGILPREEGDPEPVPDLESAAWLNCLVCKQPLQRVYSDGTAGKGTAVKRWLYCSACDRMQRRP